MHWAAELIGRPYERNPTAPDSFNCWSLVRYVFEHVHGIAMPVIAVGPRDQNTSENVAAIKRSAMVSGWRPSHDHWPAEHDIVLMNGVYGRHVGVIVAADGSRHLLHCINRVGVCVQPLSDLQLIGFRDFAFWRRRA